MEIDSLLPKSTYSIEDDIQAFNLDENFCEHGINFVAIDLETATFERNSIYEIGITIIENSQVKAVCLFFIFTAIFNI